MVRIYKQIKIRFFELFPVLILFFISLNGQSVIDLKFFSINVHYILVYFWVLRRPQNLGYGFIFVMCDEANVTHQVANRGDVGSAVVSKRRFRCNPE